MVIFIFPYPYIPNISARGIIFIQYPREVLFDEFIRNLSGSYRFLTIRNDISGAVLFSNVTPSPAEASRSIYVSPASGYSYEIATPLDYYTSILKRFQITLTLAVISLFCLGFLLNLLIERYNVQPLRKLVGKFGPPDSSVDFKSIETVLSAQKTARERSDRDAILLTLIQGGFHTLTDLRSVSAEVGLDFSSGFFAFIIVHSNTNAGSSVDRVIMGPVMFYRFYQRSGENEMWVYSGSGDAFNEQTMRLFRDAAYPEDPQALIAASTVSSDAATAAQRFMEALIALNQQDAAMGADANLSNIIQQYIEMHFDDKMLSLESIADFLGLSVGYLCRQFKKQSGTTVASTIQNLRIREACRLLRSTKLSVKEIVSKIGYMDHSSFSRSFKARMGMSPQEYRGGAADTGRLSTTGVP
jgi:AraC-like DNA-binding protein